MMHLGLILVLIFCSLISYPSYIKLFKNWNKSSLVFSSILGLAFVTAVSWWLAFLGLKLSVANIFISAILAAALNWGIAYKFSQIEKIQIPLKNIFFHVFWFFILSKTYFYLRGFVPDINSLEKFPDLAFIFSIFKGGVVPPLDPFTAGETINYYYLGHYQSALLSKALAVQPNEFFHLHVGMCFALAGMALYACGEKLYQIISGKNEPFLNMVSGTLATFFGVIIGNFQAFYEVVILRNPKFWYPDATRYIEHTIHEYPSYSFLVGDLHGHVINMPLAVTMFALILEWSKRLNYERLESGVAFLKEEALIISFIGFCAATCYLVNAWDIMTLLTLAGVTSWWVLGREAGFFNRRLIEFLLVISLIWIVLSIFIYLPYWITFSSPASGLKLVPPAKSSPALQLAIIWFIHIYFPLIYLIYRKGFKGDMRFLTAASMLALFFIAFVEVAYFKDIYPEHFRANTMFKLGIQSWFWSGTVSAALITTILNGDVEWSKYARYFQMSVAGLLLGAGLFWTFRAVPQAFAFEGVTNKERGQMDGLDFMRKKDISDLELIYWIRENIEGQPVLAEAAGDSFSEHGRISVYTGLTNIIQWPVHVWLWRGSYDQPFKPRSRLQKQTGQPDTVAVRVGDMQLLYENPDIELTKTILKKYNVSYLVIGRTERAKYPKLSESKFDQLGKIIFRNENVKLYDMR